MENEAFIRTAFYVCLVVAVVLVAETIYLAAYNAVRRRRGLNRRMRAAQQGAAGEKALQLLRAERGIGNGPASRLDSMKRLLLQTGLNLRLSQLLAIQVCLALAVFVALHILTFLPVLYKIPIAAVAGFFPPLQVLSFVRASRTKKFASQLPDALDTIVRSLKAGHPVPVAFEMVGKEMADPIGTEFGMTLDEMTFGLETQAALHNLGERVGVSDLSLLVTAISLQSSSGGNLAEVMGNLSRVLRDRFQLQRKVRSLSAEGRYSAYGLAILPIAITAVIYLQNPDYYSAMWEEPKFYLILSGLVVWSLIGDFIMFKMINFKY